MQESIFQHARILVVDDEPANLLFLERLLQRAKYSNVRHTSDPREVLALLESFEPDLILLDLHMPYVDGFQLLQQLGQTFQPTDYLPILVLTADTSPVAKRRALELGAKDFLTKPLDAVETMLRIRNLLHTRLLYLELQDQNHLLEGRVHERTQELAERQQQLQELARRLLVAQEEERRRIAYELHDGVAQVLASAYQHLEVFASRYHPRSPAGRESLERTNRLMRRAVMEVRRAIAGLRPLVLDDFGLKIALRQEIDRLQSEGLKVEYQARLDTERLPQVVETALFRVAQEALANIRKHAHTDRAAVALELIGQHLVRLVIRDWGAGFDPSSVAQPVGPGERVGLLSMSERIALLEGTFRIESQPGQGTTVVAEVPLSAAEQGRR